MCVCYIMKLMASEIAITTDKYHQSHKKMFIFKLKNKELNVFSKAIHALEKFNKCTNLVIESKCLKFMAVDERGSSFVEITIKGTLHHAYENINGNRELPVLEHRIDVSAVKSVARLCNKMAESIEITIDPLYESMIFEVCGTEITQTVSYTIASNIVHPPPMPTVNRITIEQELLTNVLRCLKVQDSVSMWLTPTYATFLPYTPPTKRSTSPVVPSQVLLMHSQFTDYMVQEYTRLSFRVSYLKAILAFARAMQVPLYLRFDTSDSPVTFTVTNFSYTANFSLATLGECSPTITLEGGFNNVIAYASQDALRRTAGTRRSKRISKMATPALEGYRNLTQNRQRRLSDESSF